MNPVINWFEIPPSNLDRAVRLYSDVLGRPLEVTQA